ncbi:MAG: hypothetical protein AB7O92_05120 [Acidimicrobiia bacterium]
MGEGAWVVLPAAQRADGSWIDDTLARRSVEAGVTDRAPDAGRFPRQRVELFRAADAGAVVDEAFRRRGWTDGLPVVAPTTGRVAALVRASARRAEEVVGTLAPLGGQATVERIAANAVMAGCGAEQFPYVLAAVDAVCDPSFNLAGVQTTDENVAPLVVISAPLARRREAMLHSGCGVLGPGWRGNATIGRALRLVLQNLGGGWPAAVSLAGAGQAGRSALVVVEDDDACPWEPLRVTRGFSPDDAVVVVGRAETAVNVTGGLAEVVSVMASATSAFTALHGGSAALLLAPHTAAALAAGGSSRADVAARLAAEAVIPAERWRSWWVAGAVRSVSHPGDVPVLAAPDRLLVVVAGATVPIAQHVWFPGWGFPPAHVARRVEPVGGAIGWRR